MTEPTLLQLGQRRELMVDRYLIDQTHGRVAQHLHQPVPRQIALHTDQPWEGNMCGMVTVLRDPASRRFRMYYRDGDYRHLANMNVARRAVVCLAESNDGIHWTRRLSTRFLVEGQPTNIVLQGEGELSIGTVGFFPWRDTNPQGARHELYKAISSDNNRPPTGLYLFTSPDGIHWTRKHEKPIFTAALSQRMRFDSLNVIFWDAGIQAYRLYYRDYDADSNRCIRTATSRDLCEWSEAHWLDYGPDAPLTQLYTNAVEPYPRAPHLLVGFPVRYVHRDWSPTMEQLPELEHRSFRRDHAVGSRCGTDLTDALFMSSRDGQHFHRWDEAFIRPGLHPTGNWAYGDNFPARGLIETLSPAGVPELSLFTIENYWRDSWIRRHTLRLDGFVSWRAAYAGGELLSHPLTFSGSRLRLNLATSAAGCLRVEIQDAQGLPIPGYRLTDCHEIVGDTHAYTVTWAAGPSVEALAGQPIRLRIQMADADLFALQFGD